MEQIISFQNLLIEPYEVEKLLDVKMEQKINEHSTLYVKALLSESAKDKYVKNCSQGSDVTLQVKNGENKDVLFCGIIKDIKVSFVQCSYYMELYAVSYSYLLDIEKRSRTFQDKQKTYEVLENELMEEYENAMIMDMVSMGSALGQFVVQYQETDWEFLKRLASHFHTGVVSDVHFDKIRCYFGIPYSGVHKTDAFNYSVKQDIAKFLRLSQNGVDGILEQDFVYYEIESEQPANIGDVVHFQGRELYVCQVSACMDRGVFLFHLTLTTKNGMSEMFQMHDKIVGVSLDATIDEIENDRVKVSVQVDKDVNHSPGKQCFFPYSTIYSSKDGSGWYCMPEIGDSVRIYFPDGIEEHSYAISSVHDEVDPSMQTGSGAGASDGEYSGQRDNPAVKSLRNQNGKEIRLTPGGIYIIADGTTITILDEGGVSVVSDQNIEFKSDQNIVISAEQDVSIVGLTGVDLRCNEVASIRLEDNVEVIGQEVKAN